MPSTSMVHLSTKSVQFGTSPWNWARPLHMKLDGFFRHSYAVVRREMTKLVSPRTSPVFLFVMSTTPN